ERVPAEAEPSRVRIVAIHQVAPGRDGKTVAGLTIPRHLRHLQAPVALREHGAAEEKEQRDLARLERVQILRGGDLEVVGARDRQIDLALAGEPGRHGRDVGPEERLQRVTPARAGPEQLLERRALVRGVSPSLRLDADLAAQRDRVDALAAARIDAQAE